MQSMRSLKTWLAAGGVLIIFGAGLITGQSTKKPSTLVHVVTIKWKEDATADQKKAVLEGVEKMAGQISGIRHVWTNAIKVQGEGYTSAFAIEFDNKAALDAYAKNPAHEQWNKTYLPLRGQSTTHDITN